MMTTAKIKILDDLKQFIVPLSDEEYNLLESSIKEEGCREPIILWDKGEEKIVIDGHNRFQICTDHGISFDTLEKKFKGIEEVKLWMINNQLGRRNLTPDQMSYYRGMRYLTLKKDKGGYERVVSKGNNQVRTSEKLSLEYNVSASTIMRDATFAQGLDIISKSNPELRIKILRGLVKVKKNDIQLLTQYKHPNNLVIKNEADLYNKARTIENKILDKIEREAEVIESRQIEEAKNSLAAKEPLFQTKDDRIKKIKGMILSAINKAIETEDMKAIKDLKKLIKKLEVAIFENS